MIPWENYSAKDQILACRIISIARSNEHPSASAAKILAMIAEIRRVAISSSLSAVGADGEALPVPAYPPAHGPDREVHKQEIAS